MALLTYDWHPPDPTGAVNAYLSGMRVGQAQQAQEAHERDVAQRLAADALERERLRRRFEAQQALQAQHEARLAGAEQLRQGYHAASEGRKAADILATRTAADSIVSQFSNPPLPSGGVAAPSAAQSLVQPDPTDPLIGQPPPLDPEDNVGFDDFAAAAGDGYVDTPPITPAEMLAMGRAGKLAKPTFAPAPDAANPSRGASNALPVAAAPVRPSQLLVAADGLEPVAKPRPSASPDVASLLRALPPKDVIAVARQSAASQLTQAMKPVATPKPSAPRQFGDYLIRVNPDDSITTLATKPAPTPKPIDPAKEVALTIKQRDQFTDDSKRFAAQLKDLTKDKSEPQLGYPWKENGKFYKIGRSGKGRTEIGSGEFNSGVAFARKVETLRSNIAEAEKQAAALGYVKTPSGWVEQ